jgi:hypothetical protein
MNDADKDGGPARLEPEVVKLWRKVLPRLAHYFSYPEPPFARGLQLGVEEDTAREDIVPAVKTDGTEMPPGDG